MADWPTLGVAGIAAGGSFCAVWLKAQFDRSHQARHRQMEAYGRLIAASEIVALRMAGRKSQAGFGTSISRTLLGTGRFLMIIMFLAYPRIRHTLKLNGAVATVNALPWPEPEPDPVPTTVLLDAFEEMQRARVNVRLLGTDTAVEAAEQLLLAAGAPVGVAIKPDWIPWREQLGWKDFREKRNAMNQAHEAFLAVARHEQRRFR